MSTDPSTLQQQQQQPPADAAADESGGNQFQIELVGGDGRRILQRPVDIEELLRQHQYSLPIGNGVTVRLEEYNQHAAVSPSSSSHSDSDEDYDEDYTDYDEEDADAAAAAAHAARGGPHRAPPGTHEAGGWYEVLNELRQDQQHHQELGQVGGRAVVATPMKLFPSAARPTGEARSRSIEPKNAAAAAAASRDLTNPQARREVWASFAPPADPDTNYKRMEYISVMDGVSGGGAAVPGRHFRPSALSFHAMASYLNAKDNGQRLLVYGGVTATAAAMTIQKELYEFSVLTGKWRRLEGKQFVPAGHMGHAMAVVESVDRLIVVGGVGPCGIGARAQIHPDAFLDDAVRALRARLLFPKELFGKRKGLLSRSPTPQRLGGVGATTAAQAAPAAATTATTVPAPLPPPTTTGFVPFLFDMSLSDQRWRAIQTAQPFPLAFHTVVSFGNQLYVFGGLTEEMVVSGQLIAVDVATYALRLVQPADRYHHRRRSSERGGDDGGAGTETEEEDDEQDETAEAQGPGPRFMHSAVRYGNYMIVYGGFDVHNEAQSDTWAFDLVNERWERLRCHGDAPARAAHTASVVGCRMLVVGGFACSLEESANSGEGEEIGGPATEQIVMELNLVPSVRGEYVWREDVKTRPTLPPLVFAASAPCGDDASLVVFGGLTKRPKLKKTPAGNESRARHRSSSRRRRGQAPAGGNGDGDKGGESVSTPYLARLLTLDDAVVMTFAAKRRHRRHEDDADAPHVNALGVEIDPSEMPEHLKTFIRRQEDFVKKKEAAAIATQKKTVLDEQEAMEPTIYFTDDEIERTLEKSEELCATFVSYKMDTLPGNVPDRERRIQIIENCVSLSRQVRDVVRSMKGSQIAVTAVKSKSHRRRAGQKFEDFSAAKPYRRVVIASLVDEINEELAEMHVLNKALRTVEWEEKEGFREAIQTMQNTVHRFTHTTNAIMAKYVNNRIERLVKGVEKRKEVMRLLTEVVQRNREDKIWGRDEAREQQRANGRAVRQRAEREEKEMRTTTKKTAGSRSASAAAQHGKRGASMHRRSTGAGYHTDESTARVNVTDKEWDSLLSRAARLERAARSLEHWCREGMGSTTVPDAAAATPAPPPAAVPTDLPDRRDDDTDDSSDSDSDRDEPVAPPVAVAPPVVAPAPVIPLPTPATVPQAPPPAATETPTPAEPKPPVAPVASDSPKEALIRRSNANRDVVRGVAQHAAEVASEFAAALRKNGGAPASLPPLQPPPLPPPPPPASDGAASHSMKTPPSQSTSLAVPAVPVAAAAPSKSSTSSSSTASSSSTSDSSSPAAVVLPPPAVAEAPRAITAGLGQTVTAPPPPPTAPPQQSPLPAEDRSPIAVEKTQPLAETTGTRGSSRSSGEEGRKKAVVAVAEPTAPAGYHVLYLHALRSLLELREEVEKVGGTVTLIRENEWDGNDLGGAPQDVKAEHRYKRLRSTLIGLIQSITVSFLSAAGAKKPRQRPPSTAAAAAAAAAAAPTGRVRRSASARKQQLPSPPESQPQGLPPAREGRGVEPLRAAVRHEQQQRQRVVAQSAASSHEEQQEQQHQRPLPDREAAPRGFRLGKMSLSPRTRFGELPKPPHGSVGEEDKSVKASSPLVTFDNFWKAQVEAEKTSTSPAPGPDPAPSDHRMVVEVSAIAPHQTVVVKRDEGSDAASPAQSADPPVVSVASGPTLALPPLLTNGVGATDARAAPDKAAGPAGSSIDELKRRTAASPSSGGGGFPSVAEQPATSIAPGPFVVNPEYFHSVYPSPAPTVQDAANPFPASRPSWADAEEDYFYFGRPRSEARVVGPLVPAWTNTAPATTSSGPAFSPSGTAIPVTASPPVGTVLGSQRVNATLVAEGEPVVRRPRTAAAPASRTRTPGFLRESTNAPARPETSRTTTEKTKSRLTPGELQILQGRERLRRQK